MPVSQRVQVQVPVLQRVQVQPELWGQALTEQPVLRQVQALTEQPVLRQVQALPGMQGMQVERQLADRQELYRQQVERHEPSFPHRSFRKNHLFHPQTFLPLRRS